MQAEPSNASQARRQHRRRQRCECPSTTNTLPLMSLHLRHTDVPPPTANVMSKTPPQQCRSTPATALCPNNAMAYPPPPLSLPATNTISTMRHVHHQPLTFCHPDNAVAPLLLPLPSLPPPPPPLPSLPPRQNQPDNAPAAAQLSRLQKPCRENAALAAPAMPPRECGTNNNNPATPLHATARQVLHQ
jgi:hypothetical protein